MELPLPKPKGSPVVKGVRELRANLSKYISLADENEKVIIEVYGNDRKLKSKYELKKVDVDDNI